MDIKGLYGFKRLRKTYLINVRWLSSSVFKIQRLTHSWDKFDYTLTGRLIRTKI